MGIGGQAGIEHQVAGKSAAVFCAELDEGEDLLGLLALPQVGIVLGAWGFRPSPCPNALPSILPAPLRKILLIGCFLNHEFSITA